MASNARFVLLGFLVFSIGAAHPKPAIAQTYQGQGGPGQGYGQAALAGALIGTWHIDVQGVDVFTEYKQDGSYGQVSLTPSGAARVKQVWGRYSVRQSGPNQLVVHYDPAGSLPQQICVQGGTCQSVPRPQSGNDNFMILDQNTLRNPVGIMQRSDIPPQLRQPLPATMVVAQLPQQYQPPSPSGYRPRPGISGQRCDDLQQRRICNMNDGHLVSSGGCLVCVAP